MAMFPMLSVADVASSVGWYSEVVGVWDGVCDGGGGLGPVFGQRRRGRRVLVQGWSEAYWVQPRNEPGRALRMTMTPARHDWQAGGLALQEGLVQRDVRPETTRKPRPQL